ncbi:MAG: uncharacterized protein A8A55_3024 [Amphiamblys sp. WSBS2006]|nr:MAG: uncharacterized protein A8A55_3024 [Amphiamblys sp. WSBS2006]
MVLEHSAVNILPKLMLHEDSVMEEFELDADKGEFVSEILRAKDSVWLGRVKSLRLEQYAINILPKLKLHENNVMDTLEIVNVSRDMLQKDSWILNKIKTAGKVLKALSPLSGDGGLWTTPADGGCFGWKIKHIKMYNSTVLALQWIRSDKSCVLDRFEYTHRGKEDVSQWFRFRRVYLGKIKQNGFVVPPSIKKFPSYTLVDEEGNNPIH